jgi:hypothetical protein
MSDKFKKIMDKTVKKADFSWNVGKIDLRLQKERYTPIYNRDACVEDGKLITR